MEDLRSKEVKEQDPTENHLPDRTLILEIKKSDQKENIQKHYNEMFDLHVKSARELYRFESVNSQLKNLQHQQRMLQASIPQNQKKMIEMETEWFEIIKNEITKNLTSKQKKKLDGEDYIQLVRNSFSDIQIDFLNQKIILGSIDSRFHSLLNDEK